MFFDTYDQYGGGDYYFNPGTMQQTPEFGVMSGVMGAVTGVLGVLMSFYLLYAIIAYIFRSIGLYHMAKNRGIAHAWFAWVPILSNYIIGRLINNKVVLGDSIVTNHADFFLPFLGFLGLTIMPTGNLAYVVTAAIWVYEISALWRLFKIYRPKSRVSFTIWSIILGSGFFIFAVRDDKPFDPLEPDKVYQDFYSKRNAIEEKYHGVEESIREQKEAQEAALKDRYEEKLAQEGLTAQQKDQISDEYHEDRDHIRESADFIINQERQEQRDAIDDLEASMHVEETPIPEKKRVIELKLETPLTEASTPSIEEISKLNLEPLDFGADQKTIDLGQEPIIEETEEVVEVTEESYPDWSQFNKDNSTGSTFSDTLDEITEKDDFFNKN